MINRKSPAIGLLAAAGLLMAAHTANAGQGGADQTSAPLPTVVYPLSASQSAIDAARPVPVAAPAVAPQIVQVIYGYSYPPGEYFWFGGVLTKRSAAQMQPRVPVAPVVSLSNGRQAGIVLPRAARFGGGHYR